MRGTGKAYRTHVHHSSTPYLGPWSFRVRRWLIKQPGEQSCCCSLIYKVTHFKDGRRIRPLFLPPHPRRNRNTPARKRVCIADSSLVSGSDRLAFSQLLAVCSIQDSSIPAAVKPQGSGYSVPGNKLTTFAFVSVIIISDGTRIFMTKL